jgi:NADH-quinone oxidoreductase subunit K
MIGVGHYQVVAAILFMIGVLGVLTRRNMIVIFMCIELMLNAANLSLIGFARMWDRMDGHIFVFMVMVVAACEVAVGLAIIISLIRNRDTLNVEDPSALKW